MCGYVSCYRSALTRNRPAPAGDATLAKEAFSTGTITTTAGDASQLHVLPQQLAADDQQLQGHLARATSCTLSSESSDTIVEPVTPRHPQALVHTATQQPFGWSPEPASAHTAAVAAACATELPTASRCRQSTGPASIRLLARRAAGEAALAHTSRSFQQAQPQELPESVLRLAREGAARAAYTARMESATRPRSARRRLQYNASDTFLGTLFIHTPKPALPAGCSTAEFDSMHHHAVPVPEPPSPSATPCKAPRQGYFAPGTHVVLGSGCSLLAAGFGSFKEGCGANTPPSPRALHAELETAISAESQASPAAAAAWSTGEAGCEVAVAGGGPIGGSDGGDDAALRSNMRGHILSMLLQMGALGQC